MLGQDQENLEIFVGREWEQEQYQRLLEREEDSWLLFLTGTPGIGKTSLLRQLKKQKPETTAIIAIDFQDTGLYPNLPTDPLQVLKALADAVKSFCSELYYTEFKRFLQRGYEDINGFNEEIKLLEQIIEPERMDQIRRNMRATELEVHQNTWRIVSSVFYGLIDTFKKRQLVLMFDTCERLLEPGGLMVGQWLMNEFLPELQQRVIQQDKSCFVVMASREPLPSAVIPKYEQRQISLRPFTEEEMSEYLTIAGLRNKMDSSGFQSIVGMTQGHPLTLALIGQLWEKSGSEKDENIATFQSEVAGSMSKAFVQERILQRLGTPYKQLTEYVVLLRSFNLPQLQVIFPELFEGLSEKQVDNTFDRFIRYPYIEPLGDYRYTFHPFVREVLARYTREQHPEEWKRYHQRAFAYFTPAEGEQPAYEWYYHFIAFNEMEEMKAWKEAIGQARADGRSADVGSLLEVAGDKTLDLTLQSQILLLEEEELFYRDNGQIQKAEESRRQIEHIRQELELTKGRAKESQAGRDEVLVQEPNFSQKSGTTGRRAVADQRGHQALSPFLSMRKPSRVVSIFLLIIALAALLTVIAILLSHIR